MKFFSSLWLKKLGLHLLFLLPTMVSPIWLCLNFHHFLLIPTLFVWTYYFLLLELYLTFTKQPLITLISKPFVLIFVELLLLVLSGIGLKYFHFIFVALLFSSFLLTHLFIVGYRYSLFLQPLILAIQLLFYQLNLSFVNLGFFPFSLIISQSLYLIAFAYFFFLIFHKPFSFRMGYLCLSLLLLGLGIFVSYFKDPQLVFHLFLAFLTLIVLGYMLWFRHHLNVLSHQTHQNF